MQLQRSCTTFLVGASWAWLGRATPTKPLMLTLSEPGTQTRSHARRLVSAPGLSVGQMATAKP